MSTDLADLPPANVFISTQGQSALIWIEFVAASAFVGFRTVVQYRHNKKLFSNDILILVALSLHFASALISQLMIPPMYELERLKTILQYGAVPPANTEERTKLYLRYQYAVCMTFWCCLWAVKFSLLLFFWRLFDSLHTRMRYFWWVMCFVTASTLITTIFLQIFACGEPSSFFKLGPEGCFTDRDIYMSNLVFLFSAGTDIACDVFLIFIPFPLLWKLQVSQRQKIGLVVIFLLPLIPICFGILRLVFCNPVVGTVDVIKFTFYFSMENTAAIITACLPSMRLFFLQKTGQTTLGGGTAITGAGTTPRSRTSRAFGKHSHSGGGGKPGIFSNAKKSLFSASTSVASTHLHLSSQKSEYNKGGILLTEMERERDPRRIDTPEEHEYSEHERRESDESRSRILSRPHRAAVVGGNHARRGSAQGSVGKMEVMVTREFSVGTAVSEDVGIGGRETPREMGRERDLERGKAW